MVMEAKAMVDLIIKSVFHLGNADSHYFTMNTLVRGLDVRFSYSKSHGGFGTPL